jgi:hypothetical protein
MKINLKKLLLSLSCILPFCIFNTIKAAEEQETPATQEVATQVTPEATEKPVTLETPAPEPEQKDVATQVTEADFSEGTKAALRQLDVIKQRLTASKTQKATITNLEKEVKTLEDALQQISNLLGIEQAQPVAFLQTDKPKTLLTKNVAPRKRKFRFFRKKRRGRRV